MDTYAIDDKNKTVTYKLGAGYVDLIELTEEFAKTSTDTDYTIESNFNGTKLRTAPGMSGEEVYNLFKKSQTEKEQSQQSKSDHLREEIEKKKEKEIIAKDTKLISDTAFDVSGHSIYVERTKQEHPGNTEIMVAERWGCLMQKEMEANGGVLTPEIVDSTQLRAEAAYDKADCRLAPSFLVRTWAHGRELGKIFGIDKDRIDYYRALASDKAIQFNAELSQKKNFKNESMEKYAKTLSKIFPTADSFVFGVKCDASKDLPINEAFPAFKKLDFMQNIELIGKTKIFIEERENISQNLSFDSLGKKCKE